MRRNTIAVEKIATIEFMLKDKTIHNALLMEKEVARSIKVVGDGSVILGKTSWKWWNHFVGDERVITFNELCILLIDIISGHPSNKNEIILEGLKKYFVDGIFDNVTTPEFMIDLLFDSFRNGYNSPYSSCAINFKTQIAEDLQRPMRERRYSSTPINGAIAVRINPGEVVYVPLSDLSNLSSFR